MGGYIRTKKGKIVENLARTLTRKAWENVGGAPTALSFGDVKKFLLPVRQDYLERLPDETKEDIITNVADSGYEAQVDLHIFINRHLVMGIECKAYAENAMLKRILVDFSLLRSLHPDLVTCLFQLESMLGGDYSDTAQEPKLGSTSSHALMSQFPDVQLHILTLMGGERHPKRPIHQAAFYKPLTEGAVNTSIAKMATLLEPFA